MALLPLSRWADNPNKIFSIQILCAAGPGRGARDPKEGARQAGPGDAAQHPGSHPRGP